MNTADRSLAIMDCAPRRRFCSYDMRPAFGSKGFRPRCAHLLDNVLFDALIEQIKSLNRRNCRGMSRSAAASASAQLFLRPHAADLHGRGMDVHDGGYDILPMLREILVRQAGKSRNGDASVVC